MLDISCRKCREHICFYQKDGPGNLRRMYIDRIIDPKISVSKKDLFCSKNHLLGIKIIHSEHGEKRLAFRLFVDAVTKKIVKSA